MARTARVATTVVVTLIAALLATGVAAADPCNDITDVKCQVDGDQDAGGVTTTVTGQPGGGTASGAPDKVDCPQCEYMVAPACQANDPTEDASCVNSTSSCSEPGAVRLRLYVRTSPTENWQRRGTFCRGPAADPGLPDLGELVREEVRDLFDRPAPSYQPVRGAIVNLPTLFASGQPARYEGEPHDLAGFTVQVFATATWEWTFEPGVTRTFDQPGGPYPNYSVAHTYEDTGTYEVELVTNWSAEYTVNGEGPFPVPGGPITQTAELTVDVREARAVLVAD